MGDAALLIKPFHLESSKVHFPGGYGRYLPFELAVGHGRFGYRLIHALLQR
jgi:hypothetical protein